MQGRALPYKVNQLSGQLRSALAVTPVPATTTQDHSRQMTDIEKRKLSVQLSELQGEQLNGVLDLVASSLEGPAGEEVELDLDALPAQVLWQLKAYADGILHRVNKPLPGGMAAPSKRPAITDGGAGAVSAGGGQALQGGGAQAGGHTYRRSHDMEDAAENTKASSGRQSSQRGSCIAPGPLTSAALLLRAALH
jgi:DNA-binding protein Fis